VAGGDIWLRMTTAAEGFHPPPVVFSITSKPARWPAHLCRNIWYMLL
jgi:hypothetical protein